MGIFKLKKVLKILVAIFLVSKVVILIFSFSKIHKGKLIYIHDFGWVDLNHAIPTSAIRLIDNFRAKLDGDSEFVKIEYSQNQRFLFYKMQAEMTFRLRKSMLTQKSYCSIFKKVSLYFESQQKKNKVLYNSLNNLGDMNGNYMSLYCAINNIPLSDYLKNKKIEIRKSTCTRLLKNWLLFNIESGDTLVRVSSGTGNILGLKKLIQDIENNSTDIDVLEKETKMEVFGYIVKF